MSVVRVSKKVLGSPLILGGAIAGVLALIILTGILVFLCRRRRHRRRTHEDGSPLTPELPLQGPDTAEAGLGSGFRSVPITPNRWSKKSPKFFPGVRASKSLRRNSTSTGSIAPLVRPTTPPESLKRSSDEVSRYAPSEYVVVGNESPGRQREVLSRFTFSDYDRPASSVAPPPIPPIPAESHTRQARDHVSRFTLSDYAESDSLSVSF
jgi:hypothetical protein